MKKKKKKAAVAAAALVGLGGFSMDKRPNTRKHTHLTYVDIISIISIGSGSSGCIRGPLLVQYAVAAVHAARLG